MLRLQYTYVFKRKCLLLTESVSQFIIHPCLLILATTETTQASQTFSLSYEGKPPAKHVGMGWFPNHTATFSSVLRAHAWPKVKFLVQWSMASQWFWCCGLLEACSYAAGPQTWLFLFTMIWLLSPEDTFVLVNEHNFCYPPLGGNSARLQLRSSFYFIFKWFACLVNTPLSVLRGH